MFFFRNLINTNFVLGYFFILNEKRIYNLNNKSINNFTKYAIFKKVLVFL